jgi:hypothetical protein
MGKALQGDIYKAAGLAALVLALSVGGAVAAHAAKSESDGSATTTGSYLAAFHAEYIGDSTAAADFLGHVLAADAGNATVRRRAFIHLVSSGRVEQAVPLAEKIKSGGRTAALATITLSTVAARTGDLETADALLAAPLPGNFGEVIAPMLRAWIRQGLSDLDGAIEMLAPLEEDDGLKLFRDIQAALIYDLAGQPEKAETAYARAMVGGDSPALRLVEAYVSWMPCRRISARWFPMSPRRRTWNVAAKRAVLSGRRTRAWPRHCSRSPSSCAARTRPMSPSSWPSLPSMSTPTWPSAMS